MKQGNAAGGKRTSDTTRIRRNDKLITIPLPRTDLFPKESSGPLTDSGIKGKRKI